MTESPEGLLKDLRSLGSKALVYGLGNALLRGLTFLLLPVYTRYLTPEAYGVVAVAATVTSLLGILFPLSLHSATTQQYFAAANESDRRERLWTLWVSMLASTAVLTTLLDILGPWFLGAIARGVPYHPYLRMASWTAFFGVFGLLPLNLLQIQGRPALYVLCNAGAALLTVGIVLERLAIRNQGAYGYVFGTMAAGALMVVPYLILTAPQVRLKFRWDVLRQAFVYGLPILPHLLASWVLSLSDRMILERFRPVREVGLYLLGYQIASLLTLAAAAANAAWVPFLFRTYSESREASFPRISKLATYLSFGLVWLALGLALMGRHVVEIMASTTFHESYRVIPWCVGGFLLAGLYLIPVNFLFLKSKTAWLPLATVVGGAMAVVLNLLLVPDRGMVGAAVAGLAGNAIVLYIVWAAARRVVSFPYEYGRLAHLLGAGGALFVAGTLLAPASGLLAATLRAGCWLSLPIVLIATGFLTAAERARLRRLIRHAPPLEGGPSCL